MSSLWGSFSGRSTFVGRRLPLSVFLSAALVLGVASITGCTAARPPSPAPSFQPSPTPTIPGSAIVLDPLIPDASGWVGALPSPTTGKLLPPAQAQVGMSMPWKFIGFGSNHSLIQVAYVEGDGDCVLPEGFYIAELHGDVVVAAVSRNTGAQSCSGAVVIRRAWLNLPLVVTGNVSLQHAPVDPNFSSSNFFQ